MPDSELGALTAASTPSGSNLLYAVQSGAPRKMALSQVLAAARGWGTVLVAASDAPQAWKDMASYICDGTDDQTEINTAIGLVGSATGTTHTAVQGRVVLSPGNFRIASPIHIDRSHFIFEGQGRGEWYGYNPGGAATRLRYAAGLTGELLRVWRTDQADPCGEVTLRDFVIDGAATDADGGTNRGGTAIDGIKFRAFDSTIQNVHVTRMSGHGIRVQGYTAGGGALPGFWGRWATYDSTIINCRTDFNGASGLFCDDTGEDLQIIVHVSHDNVEDGIRCAGSSNQFFDIHVYGNTRYGCSVESTAARVKFVGGKVEHNGQDGLRLLGAQPLVTGLNIHLNGQTTHNTYPNLYCNASNATISANSIGCDTGEGGNLPKYGVEFGASATGLFAGNTVFGGAQAYPTANILNAAGANVRIVANDGVTANAGNLRAVEFLIDGGGSAITTGVKGDVRLPFSGAIEAWTVLGDQSGSIVVDVWKDTYANFPPVVADTITAAAKPTLTAAAKAEDTTLTGWTKAVAAGDVLRFNVDSASTVTRVTVVLYIRESV